MEALNLTPDQRKWLVERVEKRTPRFPLQADRANLERQWLYNWHFYNGRAFLRWNPNKVLWEDTGGGFSTPYIANLIRPTVQRTVSKLVGSKPIPRVAPETEDVRDRGAARLGEKALIHLFDSRDFQAVAEQAATHMLVTGMGFFKVFWNPEIGPYIKFYKDDNGNLITHALSPDEKAELEAKEQYTELPAGDVDIGVVSPFSLQCDPDIVGHDMSVARWVCESTIERKSILEMQYGAEAVAQVSFEDTAEMGLINENLRFQYTGGGLSTAVTVRDEEDDPRVLVKTYYERESDLFPKGVQCVIAGSKLLEANTNTYCEGAIDVKYPYFVMQFATDPEKFWVDGLVSQLWPVQEEYSRIRSQVIRNIALMANPKWGIADGSEISEAQLNSEEGEAIIYNPNYPEPKQIQPAALPNYVPDHINALLNEFQVIAADRDPTQAKTPSSLRSGVAIQLIDEKDRHVLSATMSSVRQSVQRVARAALVLMGEFYDEPRVLKVAGEAFSFEVESLLGADLRRNYDVRIYIESGAGESRAGRQQAILDYVQLMILDPTNPDDKRHILKALEYGDPQDYISEMLIDERQAEIENQRMREGIRMPVLPWYNHAIHARIHRRDMKSEWWMRLPEGVKNLYVEHLNQHDQELAKMIQAQLATQELARGGPGQKGTPSPPNRTSNGRTRI